MMTSLVIPGNPAEYFSSPLPGYDSGLTKTCRHEK